MHKDNDDNGQVLMAPRSQGRGQLGFAEAPTSKAAPNARAKGGGCLRWFAPSRYGIRIRGELASKNKIYT